MKKKPINLLKVTGTAFLVLFFYASSICLTFYNKWMSKRYKFPLSVSMVHFVVVFLLSAFFRRLFEWYYKKKRIVLTWSVYFKKIFPSAIAASLDIGLSNWSIMLSTVSLYTMGKSSSILFILFFSLLLRLENMSWMLFLVVVLISSGLFLFTFESKQFDMLGFTMAILASAMSGIRWTTAQLVMQKKNIGLQNPLDAIFHIQPIMALTMIIFAFSMEGSELASSLLIFRAPSVVIMFRSLLIIFTGAILAFLLTVSEFLLVSNTSGMALSIAGIFKEVCTLTIAAEFCGDKWTAMNFVGLVVCMSGISLHVVSNAVKASPPTDVGNEENRAMDSLLNEEEYFSSDTEETIHNSSFR